MSLAATAADRGMNREDAKQELFVLTDEQILEIDPETKDGAIHESHTAVDEEGTGANGNRHSTRHGAHEEHGAEDPFATTPGTRVAKRETSQEKNAETGAGARDGDGKTAPQQPPEWLAQRMRDPWNGAEAREFWEGLQRDQQETAAYREVFAKPEEARASAERARALDEFDLAYFGAPGKQPQELSASRAQLAQRMLQEDPAAFREMVFAGLRALEQTGKAETGHGILSAPASAETNIAPAGKTAGTQESMTAEQHAHVARYAEFEKSTNDELERRVGGAIARTLEQALPALGRADGAGLREKLAAVVRQDVEKALQSDRQLGEQVAQVMSSRRLDDGARAQVVRLIGERAQQLVPGVARKVLGDWTNTSLAAHRGRTQERDEGSKRREAGAASSQGSVPGSSRKIDQSARQSEGRRPGSSHAATSSSRNVDYRKLSDEQILGM